MLPGAALAENGLSSSGGSLSPRYLPEDCTLTINIQSDYSFALRLSGTVAEVTALAGPASQDGALTPAMTVKREPAPECTSFIHKDRGRVDVLCRGTQRRGETLSPTLEIFSGLGLPDLHPNIPVTFSLSGREDFKQYGLAGNIRVRFILPPCLGLAFVRVPLQEPAALPVREDARSFLWHNGAKAFTVTFIIHKQPPVKNLP